MMKTGMLGIMLTMATTAGSYAADQAVFPGKTWAVRPPEDVGLSRPKLDAFAAYVGGRGCIVRHGAMVYTWGDATRRGDVASAAKPVYAHCLFKALEKGLISRLDDPVVALEPGLRKLNPDLNYKDRTITWRHLANQISCYGVRETPGTAFCYNDWQMALFWDLLFTKVYGSTYSRVDADVLNPLLGLPLQWEDRPTFMAFGIKDRPGRLSISPRDFARFGLLYLHHGAWRGKQLLSTRYALMAVTSPLPNSIPRSQGRQAQMLPHQRSIGSRRIPDNQTDHMGSYSWLWWLNGVDRQGKRHWPDAPEDIYGCFGHGGPRVLAVFPSLDMIVSWNDTRVRNPQSENEAFRLLVAAQIKPRKKTRVSLQGGRWFINGTVTYPGSAAEGLLMNVRMVNATFEDRNRSDFDADANTAEFLAALPDYVAHGVRAFTLNLQGGMPGYEGALNSAFGADGNLRSAYLERVKRVIRACDRAGAVVILGCYYQRQSKIPRDNKAIRAGVVNAARWIRSEGFTNVVLEIANEYSHPGFVHPFLRDPKGQAELIRLARQTTPGLLVATSGCGDATLHDPVAEASDFLLVHFNGLPATAVGTRIKALKRFGKPIVCNEDDRPLEQIPAMVNLAVRHGVSYGLMLVNLNQHFPFVFHGAADAPKIYAEYRRLTTATPP